MPTIIPIPAFTDNYIWLIRAGERAVVVDPGDAAPVLAYLERERLTLTAILNTHHHGDHVGGNAALVAHAAVPVYGPAREQIPGRTKGVVEGDLIALPEVGLTLEVLDVPGHTAGHVAWFARDDGAGGSLAFVGDTLFACGCGRVFEGTAEQMCESLAKLAALPEATRVYCAHEYTLSNLRFALGVVPGDRVLLERQAREQAKRDLGTPTVPTTILEERASNPFLRTSVPRIVAAAEARAGRRLSTSADVFATLREWKNQS